MKGERRFSAAGAEAGAAAHGGSASRNGRPHVMVISIDDFESLQMTRELLAEPGAVQDILAADQEISAGDYHTLGHLRAAPEERQRQDDAHADAHAAAHPGATPTPPRSPPHCSGLP